ncbi:uncharacterized protein N7506_004030 [Penicillium brevicompactum]|uniref:uncharacterized protein n=1 Tax=Penicillium brevicompactum TaxID=5074 RepID=UPI00253F9387|nr:uncharacterized protein N7506_004030 [Penicillium brevicompactum]KAJ5336008.1 hypothetical protein N7506_004030 [Penicillium brevicompactum]
MNNFPLTEPSPPSTSKKCRTRQSGTAWTRSGCLTCKKRRKACDKQKPSCNNCLKQGRTCEGYGSMWVEPLGPSAQVFSKSESKSEQPIESPKRRRLSESASQLPSPAPSASSDAWFDFRSSGQVTPWNWSNVSSPRELGSISSNPVTSQELAGCAQEYVDVPADAMIPRPQGHISHLSCHETHYLQYHMEQGSRLLANLESDDNPLRSILIPRAMSSPLLMKAVCAVSALHLANRSQGFGAHTAAVNYYSGTLSGLRSALGECSTELLPDDAMLAVGLLCKYEIVRGSVKQWVVHLNALQRLIVSRGGFASMDRDAAEFLRGLFVYAYQMARISNHNRITPADISVDSDIGIPKLDIYIGYTEELLELCARIAELPASKHDNLALYLSVASINESLLNWTHTSTPYVIPSGTPAATLTRLQLVAECFRDAGFAYLHSIMEHISRDLETAELAIPVGAIPTQDWCSLISSPKQPAIDRCLARVKNFPLDDHCEYSALTFPLFISGCESNNIADREVVLQSLDKLQHNFGIGNVRRAKELLGILWARRDADSGLFGLGIDHKQVHWLDIVKELGWELILA